MSLHSYSRVWLHIVWATLERRQLLGKPAAARLSTYLQDYAKQKGIYMKINFVTPDHVHALIDLPTNLTIEDMMQLFKGSSSHWINAQNLVAGRFGWCARLRRVFGFGIRGFRSLRLYRESGRTPSQAHLCRRTEVVCGALRPEVAKGRGMKLLKQFRSRLAARTSLKRGVNEKKETGKASFPCDRVAIVLLPRRENQEVLLSLTPDFSRVSKNKDDGNRFNGFLEMDPDI